MAHTTEQRDKHALCGARKKNGQLCRKFAGEGTDHFGVGRCKYHLGNTKNMRIHAAKQAAEQRAIQFGEPIEISPAEALLATVHLSAGHLQWLREELAKADKSTFEGQVVLRMYNDERDRLSRTAKLAMDAGVAERMVAMAERYGATIASVIRTVLYAPQFELTPQQEAVLPDLLRDALAGVEQDGPLALPAA